MSEWISCGNLRPAASLAPPSTSCLNSMTPRKIAREIPGGRSRSQRRSPHRSDRRIERIAQALDDVVDLSFADDEGRREQDMVSPDSVDRAAHRIDHQAARHRFLLYARVQLARGIERSLRTAVGDKLDAAEQPAPSDIADMRIVGEALLQPSLQTFAHRPDIGEQAVAPDDLLNCEAGGCGHRMAHIGMAMLEEA